MAPRNKKEGGTSTPPYYGSVSSSSDDEETALLEMTTNNGAEQDDVDLLPSKKKYFGFRTSNRRRLILVGLLGLVAVVAALVTTTRHSLRDDAKQQQDNNNSVSSSSKSSSSSSSLFANMSPISMGLLTTERTEKGAAPSTIWGQRRLSRHDPLPTNSWYLNLISHRASVQPDESSRVYTVPYIVDTAPPSHLAGIRLHWPIVSASSNNIQMLYDWKNGISLGAKDSIRTDSDDEDYDGGVTSKYRVVAGNDNDDDDDDNEPLSLLGVRLEWTTATTTTNGSTPTTTTTNRASSVNSTTTTAVLRQRQEEQQQEGGVANAKRTRKLKRRMVSSIVRGMPYATMEYYGGVLPVLYSYNGPAVGDGSTAAASNASSSSNVSSNTRSPILGDGKNAIPCGVLDNDDNNEDENDKDKTTNSGGSAKVVDVQNYVELHFINSDFKWGVFFSQPVQVQCAVTKGDDPKTREFQLQVVNIMQQKEKNTKVNGEDNDSDDEPLTVRVALLDQCTTGKSDIQSHCVEKEKFKDQDKYEQLLKDAANIVPTNPQLNFTYHEHDNDDVEKALMTIDWKSKTTGKKGVVRRNDDHDHDDDNNDDLLMFAMPHHQETLDDSVVITDQCIPTFHGRTCLVRGNVWTLVEDLGAPMSFTARRPPDPSTIPALADALSTDIHYKLSDNMHRGAADTYFSGKILTRLGRIIVIASELKGLAAAGVDSFDKLKEVYDDVDDKTLALAMEAASSEELPSDQDVAAAVEELKQGVEIWLTEQAEAPYVYDRSWGGIVNCGCTYHGKDDKGICNNTFPNCPALADVNEDFGNGWYNDHHYHYGYHVSAAAVVSKYDPAWGKKFFDRVLLYIRDFANPSPQDEYFTQFRQKDWFLGSSWASGIVSAENSPHGRNEESSSEAIAAYEAVALYGSVMMDVFRESSMADSHEIAKQIRNAGQLLTATELRAANRYWHVWSSDTHNNTYPEAYQQLVVGMLYDTMASFQTWFAPYPLVSYGIQLMPLTPVAERRDDPEWASELYPLYDKSCKTAGNFCIDNGWSILQAGLCATAGNKEEAMKQALAVPTKVFASDGGVGNSLTNTIWYIGTRKAFDDGNSTV